MRTMNVYTILLLTACIWSGSGCSGGKNEKVVRVNGTVTHNGQPVPGIVVSFVPVTATETGVSTGTTDDNGQYSLKVAKTGSSGAVVGTHKIWVSRPREPFVNPQDKEEVAKQKKLKKNANPADTKPPADLTEILKKYGNLDKSTLTKEVKDGGEPIDLKLD
jgi:hypothetical protein